MLAGTHHDMHREHQTWLSEIALWRDETALWREQAEAALGEATRRVELLQNQMQLLAAHEESICGHARTIRTHEHVLANFERDGDAAGVLLRAKRHGDEAVQHEAARQAHDEVKRWQLAALEESGAAATSGCP